jgi:hypothetical protein
MASDITFVKLGFESVYGTDDNSSTITKNRMYNEKLFRAYYCCRRIQ